MIKTILVGTLLLGGCASVPIKKVTVEATAVPIKLSDAQGRVFSGVSIYSKGIPLPKWSGADRKPYILVDKNRVLHEPRIYAHRKLVVKGDAMVALPRAADGRFLLPLGWNFEERTLLLRAKRNAIRILE